MKKYLLLSFLFLSACGKDVTIKNPSQPNPPVQNTIPDNRQVNGSLVANGNVSDKFKTSPNGQKVVYLADESTDTVDDLYVVDVPSLSNKINLTNLALGKRVSHFAISPNSQKVAFLADMNNTGRFDLFTVNLDGSNLHQVNLTLASNTQVVEDNFKWANDSVRLVYASSEVTVGQRNIYVANFDGANRSQINGVNNVSKTFALAPDNSRVVYRQNVPDPMIRSVTLAGTNDIALSASSIVGGVFDFKINKNSNKVLYRSNQDIGGTTIELFSVNLDGTGLKLKLNSTIVSGGSVSEKFEFANDAGTKVVYIADQEVDGMSELYSVNIDGSSNTKLNATLVPLGDVTSFKVTADASRVVYLADTAIATVKDLHSVSINGGSSTKINSNLIAGEKVVDQYDLVGSNVLYSSDKGSTGVFSVYSNNLLGTNEVRLNQSITSGQGFFDTSALIADQFIITNDSSKVLLVGAVEGSVRNLYSVNMDGSEFVQLNESGQQGIMLDTNTTTSLFGSTLISVSPFVLYRQNSGSQVNLILGRFKVN